MEISKNASSSNSSNNSENHFRWNSSENKNKDNKGLSDKNRIGFLNQCKQELSAEVYHWKEENFKLRKENETAMKRIDELEAALNKLSHQSKQLESNLFLSQEDNKRLRMRTVAIGEQNTLLHEKLTKSRFHSYPWSEMANQNRTNSFQDASCVDNTSSSATESLEEVSKRLFKQMQQEILEMQKFEHALCVEEVPFIQNKNLSIEKSPENKNLSIEKSSENEKLNEIQKECPLQIEQAMLKIKSLLQEINTLKHHVKFQNEKLQFLLIQMSKGNEIKSNCDKKNAALNSLKGTPSSSLSVSSRPTDEKFRAYFTKQLNSCKNIDESKRSIHEVNQSSSKNQKDKEHSPNSSQQVKYQTNIQVPFNTEEHFIMNKGTNYDNEKICPICKVGFSKLTPQREFEAHVIEHLEAVGTSLLEQC